MHPGVQVSDSFACSLFVGTVKLVIVRLVWNKYIYFLSPPVHCFCFVALHSCASFSVSTKVFVRLQVLYFLICIALLVAGHGVWYFPENCSEMQAQVRDTTGRFKSHFRCLLFCMLMIVLSFLIMWTQHMQLTQFRYIDSHVYAIWYSPSYLTIFLFSVMLPRWARTNHLFLNCCPTFIRQFLIWSHTRFILFMNRYVEQIG
jgi:uncharacterized membrane protein YidH (DUF202 family)